MNHPSIFTTSWVVLLLLAAALTAFSLFSASLALRRAPDALTGNYTVEQVESASHEAADAIRGRRLTASAWAFGCGLFLAFIVLGPYRRGERWAWWALLVAFGGTQVLSMLRVPLMGVRPGASTALILLVVLAVGLLAGAPRMFASAKS